MSSACLRLLIFLLEILIPACASSNLAFCIMYSACKLNKQRDNIQPWLSPFPVWNQSVVPCLFLTVASWPAYRFLGRQVRWFVITILWRIFQFVVIHIVKGFRVFNEEVDIFLELSCFSMIQQMLVVWSLVFSKSSLHKLESRFLGEISISSDMQITPSLWQKMKN